MHLSPPLARAAVRSKAVVCVVVDFLFIVTPIVGVCNCSMFCCTLLYVYSSIAIILMGKRELGPISSTSLRRVFVLKTSYEVRTLKIGFHQIIELCELLTFCRIFKTNI